MRPTDFLLALVVAMIWGFNFVAIKVGLDSFPPLYFSALRFLVAAFPAVLIWGRKGVAWRWILAIGVTLGIVMFSLLYLGIYFGLPAGLSSLVLQSQAVFTLLLSGLFLKSPPDRWQLGGILTALAGMGALAVERFDQTSFLGLILVVSAGLAWAVSNIIMKVSGEKEMFRLVIWMSLVPPLPLFLLSLLFESGHKAALLNLSWSGLGALLFNGPVSTVLAFGLWGLLFRRYSPNLVAPFGLTVPIFGIFSAVLFLGEELSSMEILSSMAIFGGLMIIGFGSRLNLLSEALKKNRPASSS